MQRPKPKSPAKKSARDDRFETPNSGLRLIRPVFSAPSGVPSPAQVKTLEQSLAWRRVEMAKQEMRQRVELTNPHFHYVLDETQTMVVMPPCTEEPASYRRRTNAPRPVLMREMEATLSWAG